RLAPVAPGQGRPRLAAATGEHRRDPLVLGAGPQDRPPQPGMSLDADAPRVHVLVRREVIDDAADAPGPGADRTPLVQRRRGLVLLQREADDTFLEGVVAVWLDVVVADAGEGPAAAEDLCGDTIALAPDGAFAAAAESDRQDDRHWPLGLGRQV